MEVFHKLIVSFWVCVARYVQNTQNNKFAISFQYLKENLKDEVHFLLAVRHAHITQNNKVAISLQYFKKEVSDEIRFPHLDKHVSSLQIDTMIFDGNGQTFPKFTLGIKVSYKLILSLLMGMIKHSQSTQISKHAISLQYLKKEVREGVHFLHLDKHQSFYKLALF